MGYLVLARRVGSYVRIDMDPDADPIAVLAAMQNGGIMVSIKRVLDEDHARIAIKADRSLRVRRGELTQDWDGYD